MNSKNKIVSISAWIVIALSGVLMFASAYDDSPSYDEIDNIAAGYYYVTTQSYWINHYQPPLVKDFSGLVVAATNPKSFLERPEWSHFKLGLTDIFFWGQPDAQNMLRLARIPSMIFAIAFLVYFFKRIEREFGSATGLIAVTMMGMSPTFLTHARFVTTDVPGASCFFIGLFTFIDYLRKPNTRSLTVLAIVTGLALLVKFSLTFLLPMYCLLFIIWNLTLEGNQRETTKQLCLRSLKHASVFLLIVASIVWLGYYINMMHMTPKFQEWYVHKHLKDWLNDPRVELISITSEIPILRPFSWYFTGLFGQFLNVRNGHFSFSYLQGALYKGGNLWYFPYLLTLKEPIGFLILFLTTVAVVFAKIGKNLLVHSAAVFNTSAPLVKLDKTESEYSSSKGSAIAGLKHYVHLNFVVFASIIFATLYFAIAMRSNLNIGLRHILPVISFMYMLTAIGLVGVFNQSLENKGVCSQKNIIWAVSAVLLYGCASSLLAYPGYLSYYNELAGGKTHGLNVAIDSNFDWGTDLYRLKKFVDENKIDRINLLYFGVGSPEYYLGNKVKLWNQTDILPRDEYFAVSAHFVAQAAALTRLLNDQQGFKDATFSLNYRGLKMNDKRVIDWFCSLKPIGTAGDSILIYKTP